MILLEGDGWPMTEIAASPIHLEGTLPNLDRAEGLLLTVKNADTGVPVLTNVSPGQDFSLHGTVALQPR